MKEHFGGFNQGNVIGDEKDIHHLSGVLADVSSLHLMRFKKILKLFQLGAIVVCGLESKINYYLADVDRD
jgi:hypothetical protein